MSNSKIFRCLKCETDTAEKTNKDKINCPVCDKIVYLDAKSHLVKMKGGIKNE